MKKVTRFLAAGVFAAGVALPLTAGIAHATDDPCYQNCNTEVLPQDVSRSQPAATPAAPAAAAAAVEAENAQRSTGSLPFTGTDVVELSLIGIGAVGLGTVLVRRTRRSNV